MACTKYCAACGAPHPNPVKWAKMGESPACVANKQQLLAQIAVGNRVRKPVRRFEDASSSSSSSGVAARARVKRVQYVGSALLCVDLCGRFIRRLFSLMSRHRLLCWFAFDSPDAQLHRTARPTTTLTVAVAVAVIVIVAALLIAVVSVAVAAPSPLMMREQHHTSALVCLFFFPPRQVCITSA